MICKANAKINLSLKVTGLREDGYHTLEMVNLPIGLHDILTIEVNRGGRSTFITCDDLRLIGVKHNLCQKAVDAMRKEFGFKEEFIIDIHKEVPFAAGLGGGSSNAAATIKALNSILHLHASEETLCKVGATIGADVPFFIKNEPCKVTGIGEIMEPIHVKKPYLCLIVKPEAGLSTKDVYAICDNFPHTAIDTEKVIEGLAKDDLDLIASSMGNDLMAPAESLLPTITDICSDFKKLGFKVSMMSGSGSSCFGLTTDARLIKEATKHFEKLGHIALPTKVMC